MGCGRVCAPGASLVIRAALLENKVAHMLATAHRLRCSVILMNPVSIACLAFSATGQDKDAQPTEDLYKIVRTQ